MGIDRAASAAGYIVVQGVASGLTGSAVTTVDSLAPSPALANVRN